MTRIMRRVTRLPGCRVCCSVWCPLGGCLLLAHLFGCSTSPRIPASNVLTRLQAGAPGPYGCSVLPLVDDNLLDRTNQACCYSRPAKLNAQSEAAQPPELPAVLQLTNPLGYSLHCNYYYLQTTHSQWHKESNPHTSRLAALPHSRSKERQQPTQDAPCGKAPAQQYPRPGQPQLCRLHAHQCSHMRRRNDRCRSAPACRGICTHTPALAKAAPQSMRLGGTQANPHKKRGGSSAVVQKGRRLPSAFLPGLLAGNASSVHSA